MTLRETEIGQLEVDQWQVTEVMSWAKNTAHCSINVLNCLEIEAIDGEVLLALTENDIRDLRYHLNYKLTLGELKKLWLAVYSLQQEVTTATVAKPRTQQEQHHQCRLLSTTTTSEYIDCPPLHSGNSKSHLGNDAAFSYSNTTSTPMQRLILMHDTYARRNSTECCGGTCSTAIETQATTRATNIPPEYLKTGISICYSFLVTWITSFVMVIVHERVPDMKRYPPLPDIFLDNVPHIPWAFHMCEITGTLLFVIWSCVCLLHKSRSVLLRRFFALAGTVFLLRCVTMLITSLSVPGTHLQCHQKDYEVDDTKLSFAEALQLRIYRAYSIWSGLGMSIQGVRTCGDYMFSGHTVALTLLNFFITEYTPRNLYFLHTLTWLLNMFGIFFILAAHEHYSIDVFVAFYITSRLFLYYHTLANNQALMSRDSNRTRIWFPLFSYFENSVDGIIPNSYDTLGDLMENVIEFVLSIKDTFMLTARRFWLESPQMNLSSRNVMFVPNAGATKVCNAATSTSSITALQTSRSSPTILSKAKTGFCINKQHDSNHNNSNMNNGGVASLLQQQHEKPLEQHEMESKLSKKLS